MVRLRRALPWCLAALAVAGAVAVSALTPLALYPDRIHDDGLYMRLGRNLALGHWFGPYDQMTLPKAVGYPVFLALVAWSGLPVSIAHALLRSAAAALLGLAAARLSGRRWFGACAFALVLANPAPWTEPLLRVTRDAIHAELVLLALAGALLAGFAARGRAAAAGWGALAGGASGWVLALREEGSWLLPGMAVVAGGALLAAWRERARRGPLAAAALVAAFCALVPLALVRLGNRAVYGVFAGPEIQEPAFVAALRALQRIEPPSRTRFVPVNAEARRLAYEVSPTFATLRRQLDPGPPRGSLDGCKEIPSTCGDYASGWFHWDLRDMAANLGHHRTPAAAASFYRAIADEIDAACADGRVRCRRRLAAYLPVVPSLEPGELGRRVARAAAVVSLFRPVMLDAAAVTATEGQLREALPMLNRPLHVRATDAVSFYRLRGWYRLEGERWLASATVVDAAGERPPVAVPRLESADVAQYFGDPLAHHQRFDLDLAARPGARVRFVDETGAAATVELDGPSRGGFGVPLGEGRLWIDLIAPPERGEDARVTAVRRLRGALVRAAAVALPVLESAGLLALVWLVTAVVRQRAASGLEVAALAAWTLVVTRVALLVVVDLAVFPALHLLYLSPAATLAPVAALLSLAALLWHGEPAVGAPAVSAPASGT